MSDVRILGVDLTAQRYESTIDRLLEAARAGSRLRGHFCTVHSLVEAGSNPFLREVFETSEMVAMDGMPLVWIARLRGHAEAERVCGPDVMLSLCDRGRAIGLRHYFLGGGPGTAEALASNLSDQFPGLAIAGMGSPPFRPLTTEEDRALVDSINTANPDVLWIGLGSPKQEFWAARLEKELSVPVILPVGAAFDFHSGRLRRAPRWMQRVGLEWMFRLASEPRRLWRRYTLTNVRFAYLVLVEAISRRRAR